MSNQVISDVISRTARLLEYCEGKSFKTDELNEIALRVLRTEVPLEFFSDVDLGDEAEKNELDGMLRFWFGDFSRDGVWVLRETILTHTNPILDQILGDVSPTILLLLRVKSLPVSKVNFIRGALHIKTFEQLKRACAASELSKSMRFSPDEELAILEDVVRLENEDDANARDADGEVQRDEFTATAWVEPPRDDDPDAVFLANADALSEAIVANLSQPLKSSSFLGATAEIVKSEAFNVAREQARGVWMKAKRFFSVPNSQKFSDLRMEEEKRRAEEEVRNRRETIQNQPLEVVPVGALGRREEALSQLDYLIYTSEPSSAFDRVEKAEFVKEVVFRSHDRLEVVLKPTFFDMPYNKRPTPPLHLNFFTATEFSRGAKELALTATREHWEALERRAREKGWRLTVFGVYDGPKRVTSKLSSRIYEKLGFPDVPVEMRRCPAPELLTKALVQDRVSYEDVVADLHMHTTYSDGLADFDVMVDESIALGRRYVAFTDHTKSNEGAPGLNDVEVLRYWQEIDRLNETLAGMGTNFRVLKGAEVDILDDGVLDLTDETLAQADWIVASLHNDRGQPRDSIERRYMGAFRNPYVDVIGHPTERVIGREARMQVSYKFLCENAKRYDKALEVNSQPRRLDLGYEGLSLAKRLGVRIVVSTDSHAPDQLSYLRFGVEQARRVGLTPADVLNSMSLDEFMKYRRNRLAKALAR